MSAQTLYCCVLWVTDKNYPKPNCWNTPYDSYTICDIADRTEPSWPGDLGGYSERWICKPMVCTENDPCPAGTPPSVSPLTPAC